MRGSDVILFLWAAFKCRLKLQSFCLLLIFLHFSCCKHPLLFAWLFAAQWQFHSWVYRPIRGCFYDLDFDWATDLRVGLFKRSSGINNNAAMCKTLPSSIYNAVHKPHKRLEFISCKQICSVHWLPKTFSAFFLNTKLKHTKVMERQFKTQPKMF